MLNKIEINKLYRYAMALTNHGDEAFDLVHSAILKIEGREIQKELAYAKTIVRHLFFDQLKAQAKTETLEEELQSLDHNFEEIIINQNELRVLLKDLEPIDRELLFLILVEGFSYKEASEITGEKINTLLTRVKRLKEKIKKRRSYEE